MPDPYAGIALPKPPKGYRLARWGDEASDAMWFFWGQWRIYLRVRSTDYVTPVLSIFAVKKPRCRVPLEACLSAEVDESHSLIDLDTE